MATLRRLLQRSQDPRESPDEAFASPASHAHRERAETAPTEQLEAERGEPKAIPVPTRVSSFSRFFERAGGRSSSSSSSSTDGDDPGLEGTGVGRL